MPSAATTAVAAGLSATSLTRLSLPISGEQDPDHERRVDPDQQEPLPAARSAVADHERTEPGARAHADELDRSERERQRRPDGEREQRDRGHDEKRDLRARRDG